MAAPPQPLPLAEEETLLSSVEREALPVQRRRRAALAVSATAAAGLLAAAGLWAAGIGRSPSSHSAESTAVGLFAGPCASLGSAALADGTVAENPCKAPRYPASDDVHLGAPAGRSSALPETTPVLEASTPGSLPRHCYDDAGAPTQACALPGFSATVRDHFWKQAAQEVKATRFAEKESNVCATGNWGDSTQVNQWDQGFSPCWPSAMTISASWDTELVSRWSLELAREFGKPSRGQLGPGINLARFAWNGRLGEYMSGEDPYLGAKLSYAYVTGVQREGVIATLKHYAFNEQETNRNGGNSVVDERTAWEIYYPPFEAGVAAGAGAIMCSYNKVNGTHSCSNEELLGRDLKQKMGFRGFVMSDWWALHDEPGMSVVRGFDQEMPGAGGDTYFYPDKLELMEKSKGGSFKGFIDLPRDKLYMDPAFRILSAMHKMHAFERPGCRLGSDCALAIDSEQRGSDNIALALETLEKSVMLLTNDGILPIKATSGPKTIAIIGGAAAAPSMSTADVGMGGDYYSGGGSGHCYVKQDLLATPLKGLEKRARELGFSIVSSPSNNVTEGLSAARNSDIAIVVAATTAEESNDRRSLNLDFEADALISAVKKEKPTVVLVQAPGVVLMPWRDEVNAIAMMFLGGEHTGTAWASVVFGDISPQGKLPIMIPKLETSTVPPGQGADHVYSEGLFTSYRSKTAAQDAAFPFGHGLSYTEFVYGAPMQLPAGDCDALVCVKATVSNLGKTGRPGSEVAQAYVEFPPEAEEPKLVLRGFHRTAVLQAGEVETALFKFTARDFSIYKFGDWQLQKNIKVHLGSSSQDLRHTLTVEIPA
mmetsp:Transcript_116625/g.260524  ORF Transcript_116625/g.260524 Transcript_116625/m.260524 type:complete len:825 (+) Transcript_116625:64-2538(+)